MHAWLALAPAVLLAGCLAAAPPRPPSHAPATQHDVVLLGEQHDAAGQPPLQAQWVHHLAARGRLAALVLEMAEQGASTQGLPPTAGAAQVRAALRWNEQAWPWSRYAPAILAAVRAGVPVLGANLPRPALRAAMGDDALDRLLPPAALRAQQEAIRTGHCDLLPAAQLAPMTRMQIARDRAMAQVLATAARPGRTVLLLAGSGHVDPALGVPLHLPQTLRVHPVVLPPEATGRDYCAELRQQLRPAS